MFKKLLVSIALICPLVVNATQERPVLTTSGIVFVCPQNKLAIIERGKAPFGYAMFGGHVEHESPTDAFKREAYEELTIKNIEKMSLVGVYGNPGRDPRQHSVEVTYTCITHDTPVAATDAKTVHLINIDEAQKLIKDKKFAFDHGQILSEYLEKLNHCNPCEQDCHIGIAMNN